MWSALLMLKAATGIGRIGPESLYLEGVATSASGLGCVKTQRLASRIERGSQFHRKLFFLFSKYLLAAHLGESFSSGFRLGHVFTQPGSEAAVADHRLERPFHSQQQTLTL